MSEERAVEAALRIVDRCERALADGVASQRELVAVADALTVARALLTLSGAPGSVLRDVVIEDAVNVAVGWAANEHKGDIDILGLTKAIRALKSVPSVPPDDVPLREALEDVRSKLNDCLHGRINWRPEDWIETIDRALKAHPSGTRGRGDNSPLTDDSEVV